MAEKIMKEWSLDVPWGKVAMISWGDSSKPPVLLVHGFVDTAATFIPLVRLLPDNFYYVAFDLPGHGYSDTAPGMPVSYIHFTDIIRAIVAYLRWDTFICIAHSMGYLISSYYNAAFPGRMRKLVSLDGTVGIGLHAPTDHLDLILWYHHCFASYYESTLKTALYTYDEALSSISNARGVTREQAAVLASRCLQPAGNGMYRFTWDPKVKKISTVPLSFDMLYGVLATKTPVLAIVASIYNSQEVFKKYTKKMLAKLQKEVKNFYVLKVEGNHDVHFTNPESFVDDIIEFMNREFSSSKL